VAPILQSGEQPNYIVRGLGRSYGDTSINDGAGVILGARLDRILSFDRDTGVVECEGGISLADIIDTYLPRGYFLPVTPGTKFVTVAGAIANDVHGKNHHRDGSFGNFVQELTLLTSAGDRLICSPESNADAFWATVGGIGLTGLILSARLRLLPVESAYIRADYFRTANIDETLSIMASHDSRYRYSVAWVDCLASGKQLGRSVLMYGEHATADKLPANRHDPFKVAAPLRMTVPFNFPPNVLNHVSIGMFNAVFYATKATAEGSIVDYDRYFYPLDAIHNWNRIYGRYGFVQFQFVVPPDAVNGLIGILERLSAAKRGSFLAVLKSFGAAGPGLLSFPRPGYTLTLDIPCTRGLRKFLHSLERIVLECGGRMYFAKDALSTAEHFGKMYDTLDRFREIKYKLDPSGVLSSSMARRLGVV